MNEVLRWSACEMNVSIGLKVPVPDRDRYFNRQRDRSVILRFADGSNRPDIRANCDKNSFWKGDCRELISMDLRRWLEDIDELNWPKGSPPRVLIRPDSPGVFLIVGIESQKQQAV